MAYLKKIIKKNGKVFYFTQVNSVNFQKPKYISLDTSSKVTARARHSQVEKLEVDIKAGMDFTFGWQRENGGKVKLKQVTVKECIDLWLRVKETNVSPESCRRYRVSLNAFLTTLPTLCPISTIKGSHIEDFKRHFKAVHSDVGININLRGIKAFLRWALGEGYLESLPKIEMIKELKSKPKYLSESQWDRLIGESSLDPFYRDVFILYHKTGARRSELILGNLEGSFLIVEAKDSKTRRELEIPLNNWQVEVVQRLHQRRDAHLRSGSKIVTFKNKFTKAFTVACKKAGIYKRGVTNLHCLRHSFALMRYLETEDLYKVSKELNHTSITTTEIYAQFSLRRLEQDFPSLSGKRVKVETIKVATRVNGESYSPLISSDFIADC